MDKGKAVSNPEASSRDELDVGSLDKGEIEIFLLEQQLDVTLLIDSSTKVVYASPSSIKAFGISPEEVVGKHIIDFIHPDDRDDILLDWERFIEGRDVQPNQFRLRQPDGIWTWCEARSFLADDPRFPGCVVINLHNIKHHQRLRAHSEIAQKAAGIGTWRWNLNDPTPDWSGAMFKILGYGSKARSIDLEWAMDLYHPDDRKRLGELILNSLTTHEPIHTTSRVRAQDGTYRILATHAYIETNQQGNAQTIIGTSQDITAKVKIDKALQESERNYRLLTEQSTDLICRYDHNGRCTFASTACEPILGYTSDELLGTHALQFIFNSDRESIMEIYDSSMNGQTSHRITYRAHKKNGEVVWLESGVRTLIDAEGEIQEIIIVARDVTQRQIIQQELKAAHDLAETASRTKSRFLANMSHELRTPLNAIIGFSDIMCESMFGPLGATQYDDYAKLIRESGQFLLALINDILDMSKIEAGKYDLYLEDLDLETVIDSCRRVVEQRAKVDDIKISCSLEDGLSRVRADERTVKQIFLNLLSNAVKFTPPNGCIYISAERREKMIEIRVEDTGCGIPAEDLPRLAQPFEQVTSEATHAQSGTGLGLALVKSFVRLHGGTLDIQSELGEGTTVTFTLPISTAALAPLSPPTPLDPMDQPDTSAKAV